MNPRFLSRRAAAQYIGMGLHRFDRHVKAGRIRPFVDPDTGWRSYSTHILDEFVKSNGGQEQGSAA